MVKWATWKSCRQKHQLLSALPPNWILEAGLALKGPFLQAAHPWRWQCVPSRHRLYLGKAIVLRTFDPGGPTLQK